MCFWFKWQEFSSLLIKDDCCCFIGQQNVYAPEEDPEMVVEFYERSEEQNDLLGITDMKTEDYVTTTSWCKIPPAPFPYTDR